MADILEYETRLYEDLFKNDALLIMAEGLGIDRIFLNFIKLYSDSSHLVIILNTHEAEEDYFVHKLKQHLNANKENTSKKQPIAINEDENENGNDTANDVCVQLPTKITNETHSVNERVQVYLKGGCFFITSRILVVDMLTERIPINLISGILVYNAHRIIDSSQETFILRMFREKNKKGFIKAFSDSPVFFTRGFSKVEKIMKNLFVKTLLIYPRFHVDVDCALKKHKSEVIELHIMLSENTARIQMALMDIINVLLQELKTCCPYIDHEFLTMEMVISKPFDHLIKSQLEHMWNRIGSKPKQLISDIKTLRLLIYYLTQYDAITFYKMLNCLRSYEKESGRSSGWMFLDAANELFSRARLRVYGTEMRNYSKTDLNNRFFFSKNRELVKRIIQESPKLKTLKEVIEELESENNFNDEVNILIVAKDDRTCSQIKHFLRRNKLTRTVKCKDDKNSKGGDKHETENVVVFDERQTDEKDDEFIVKMLIKPIADGQDSTDDDETRTRKRKKIIDPKQANTLTQIMKKNALAKTKTATSGEAEIKEAAEEPNDDDNDDHNDSDNSISSQELTKLEENNVKKNKIVYLCALEEGSRQKVSVLKLLYTVKPKYVILYDSQLWFVRQLEIFKSTNPQLPLRVYFLMYKNSCEEQRYLTSVRCEKESFEILVKEKARMIATTEQDGKIDLPKERDESRQSIMSQIKNLKPIPIGGTAAAAAAAESDDTPRVIVDIREFRSELPSILHKKGFRVEPVTLEVGDYVLTPNICVERKSINDLIESLSNGRLYNQCNAMSRSYKIPLLLIEFDQNKPFQLNSYAALASNEISPNHVSSKLTLLTIHFPKLRILWCSSCAETAEIFDELKSGCQQPNADDAQKIKTDQVIENDDYKFNPILKDILLKIPGINSKNINAIFSKVNTLQDLCKMSEDELNALLENSKNAKLVFEFLNKTVKRADGDDEYDKLDFEDLDDFYVENNNGKEKEPTEQTTASSSGGGLLKLSKKTATKPTSKSTKPRTKKK